MIFINALVQQIVVFLVFVALAAVAVFAGITLRKQKNKKEEQETIQSDGEAAAE